MNVVTDYIAASSAPIEDQLQNKMCSQLASRIGADRFELWFGSETTMHWNDEKITILVKNRFAANWIVTNCLADIEAVCRSTLGKSLLIECKVAPAKIISKTKPQNETTHRNHSLSGFYAPVQTDGQQGRKGKTENLGGLFQAITNETSALIAEPHFSISETQKGSKTLSTSASTINRATINGATINSGIIDSAIINSGASPLFRKNGEEPLPSHLISETTVTITPPPISPVSPIKNPFFSQTTSSIRPEGRRFASLQTFVEGLSNRLACRAADLAVNHSGQINLIYFFGPSSVGKTHLLEGIWTAVRKQSGRKSPLYMTAEQFISGFLESIKPGSQRDGIQAFRSRFKNISILLLDDIHYFARKDATQAELFHTLDTLRNQGIQVVLSGDRPIRELSLRNEIINRLESGMVCPIELPEREMSLQIFMNMVRHRQLPINPDVCRMVTSRLGIHARQLTGALNRLHAVYMTTGKPITLDEAEETLGDLLRSTHRRIHLEDIENAVCETFGISEQALQSKSRIRQVVAPRMLAMWLARKYTRSSSSEIGKHFGNRSHSSVISAQKKVDQWVDTNHPVHADSHDLPISEAIRKIEQILQGI
ncbi:MAG: DnaA ATPase domain-containing protein [Thermoguttaceae bacterium]